MEMKPGSWAPIPVGSVVLSNSEMNDLRALGIEDIKNMKLPPDLAEQISRAQAEATRKKQLNLPAGVPYESIKMVSIEELPQDYKDALKKYVIESQPHLQIQAKVQDQVKVIVPNNPSVVPGLANAMAVAAEASIAAPAPAAPRPAPAVTRPGVVKTALPPQAKLYQAAPAVAPDNPPKVTVPVPAAWNPGTAGAAPPPPPVQAPPPAAPPVTPFPAVAPEASPAAAPQEQTAGYTDPMGDTLSTTLKNCPRCSYDLVNNKMVEEPTINDLNEFRAACIIGGHRYTKEYLVFGGELRITFRTLTQKEEDCVVAQVVRDGAANVNTNDLLGADYIRTQQRYRMIMSIENITRGGNPYNLNSFQEYDPDRIVPDSARVKAYYDTVVESVLTTSSLFSVVTEYFDVFNSYVTIMELRANDPKSYPTTLRR